MSKENLYSGKRILDNNIDDIISNLEKNLKIIENESKGSLYNEIAHLKN